MGKREGEKTPPTGKKSWVDVASGASSHDVSSLLTNEAHLDKLKASISDHINIDYEFRLKAYERFQNALYAKFLRKALPLDLVQTSLMEL